VRDGQKGNDYTVYMPLNLEGGVIYRIRGKPPAFRQGDIRRRSGRDMFEKLLDF
jgi:hypothetical protein